MPQRALRAVADSAPEGARLTWYAAEHDLNDSASRDQLDWLEENLEIDGPPVAGAETGP